MRKKHVTALFIVLWLSTLTYVSYWMINEAPRSEYINSTVLSKHAGLSTGKYTSNEFLLSVRASHDNKVYTKEVSYSTYASVSSGDTINIWYSWQQSTPDDEYTLGLIAKVILSRTYIAISGLIIIVLVIGAIGYSIESFYKKLKD